METVLNKVYEELRPGNPQIDKDDIVKYDCPMSYGYRIPQQFACECEIATNKNKNCARCWNLCVASDGRNLVSCSACNSAEALAESKIPPQVTPETIVDRTDESIESIVDGIDEINTETNDDDCNLITAINIAFGPVNDIIRDTVENVVTRVAKELNIFDTFTVSYTFTNTVNHIEISTSRPEIWSCRIEKIERRLTEEFELTTTVGLKLGNSIVISTMED